MTKSTSSPKQGLHWDAEAFRDRLTRAMEGSSYTQSEVARRLGTGPSTVNAWLVLDRIPAGDLMVLLPRALGVSGDWLFYGHGPMREAPGTDASSNDTAFQDGVRTALAALGEAAADLERTYLTVDAPATGKMVQRIGRMDRTAAGKVSPPESERSRALAAAADARRTDSAARRAKQPGAPAKPATRRRGA